MTATQYFQDYLAALRKTPLADKTEHSDRSALERLLNQIAAMSSAATNVQHEPKRAQDKGAPDFKISRQAAIIGYVEVKKVDAPLAQVLKSDQIKRYRELSDNIILTDYLCFIWIEKGRVHEPVRLCEATALEGKAGAPHTERVAEVAALLAGFFSTPPKGIAKARELAEALAVRSKLLRVFLTEELARQEGQETGARLFGLFGAFKDQVSHELTIQEFADAFAQTLAYGLFLAKLNAKTGEAITLENAERHVPGGFSLIRELVGFLKELDKQEYADIRWVVEEVLSIINWLDIDAIRADLSFKNRRASRRDVKARSEEEWRLFSKDPFVYFYEDYLAKYDAKTKKARGVYYTPPPIVNFIVRAINDILKDTFEIEQGLADRERVTVLDFACGTGTFLVEVLERIFDEIGGPEAGIAPLVVRQHILKNIYGFEYLIAPYTIAHLKLSQYLAELAARANNPDIALKEGERFQVFLTNTLEPIEPQKELFLPELSRETAAAHEVKKQPILVITGNPPYFGESKNKGPLATASVETYRWAFEKSQSVDDRPIRLKEKNLKWLQDDYVKFLRFAQSKMDEVDQGIVGVITNHAYLDNPTFRGMRQSLMRTFDSIYIVDLHGNKEKKEVAPDGSSDDNVFAIKRGVAIALFVKKRGIERGIFHVDRWGRQIDKYVWAASATVKNSDWISVLPRAPQYVLSPRPELLSDEFESFWSVRDIFPLHGTGVITKRDDLAIKFEPAEVWATVRKFVETPVSTLHQVFDLPDDVRDWSAARAQEDLRSSGPTERQIRKIHYRPFDLRYTYYTGKSRGFLGWPVERVMDNLIEGNIALLTARSNKSPSPDHFLATEFMAETKCAEATTQSYTFPLFLFRNGNRTENFSAEFRGYLDDHYGMHYSAEAIFALIYAVSYSPTYRQRYSQFFRTDFPRIPFPQSRADFDTLSALGWALVEASVEAQAGDQARRVSEQCERRGALPRRGQSALCRGRAEDIHKRRKRLRPDPARCLELPYRRLSGAR